MNPAASPPPVPSLLVMGWNEHDAGLEGWHEPERDGRNGITYRATTAMASLRLMLPPACALHANADRPDSAVARSLWILFAGSPSLLGGGPMRGSVEIRPEQSPRSPATGSEAKPGEMRRMELMLLRDCWTIRSMEIPAAWTGILRVAFRMDTPVVPDRILQNGDMRELGWYVSAAGFR